MDVSVAQAKNQLPKLIRAFEQGERVVVTRNGKPVAQLAPSPPKRRKVRFDTMRGRVLLQQGWDDPITLDKFVAGEF